MSELKEILEKSKATKKTMRKKVLKNIPLNNVLKAASAPSALPLPLLSLFL